MRISDGVQTCALPIAATAARPMQSRPTPASLPCGRNGVPMHARAALAILSPVMSKPGIAGKQVVARHMRLTLKIGGIGKAVPAGGKTLVAPLPPPERIEIGTAECRERSGQYVKISG